MVNLNGYISTAAQDPEQINEHDELVSNMVQVLIDLNRAGIRMTNACIRKIGTELLGNECDHEWVKGLFKMNPELEKVFNGRHLYTLICITNDSNLNKCVYFTRFWS